MERLTSRNPLTESEAMNLSLTDLYMRLKAYEDAEEHGRLVVLPCKVGDMVYVITKNKIIKTYTIGGVIIDQNNIWLDAREGIYGGGLLNSLQFGIDVFSTLEEAEKALEGMG